MSDFFENISTLPEYLETFRHHCSLLHAAQHNLVLLLHGIHTCYQPESGDVVLTKRDAEDLFYSVQKTIDALSRLSDDELATVSRQAYSKTLELHFGFEVQKEGSSN